MLASNLDLPRVMRVSGVIRVMCLRTVLAALASMAWAPAHAEAMPGKGTWETTLQARDLDGDLSTAEAYYDTDRHISWLANANLPYTSGYTSAANGGVGVETSFLSPDVRITNGMMGWDAAQAWATNLNVHGTTGWYLPKVVDESATSCPVFGYGDVLFCEGPDTSKSELAHMYFVTLGNTPRFNLPFDDDSGLTNTGPFSNLLPLPYWFSLETNETDRTYAWSFFADSGGHQIRSKAHPSLAWAIHDGDVGTPVPEPGTGALMLAGLAVAAMAMRGRIRRTVRPGAVMVGTGLCLAGAAFAQTTYAVHDLGTIPAGFAARGIGLNSQGVAVGSANVDPSGFHAARFGSPNVDLGAQHRYPSVANAINDSNVVVGMVYRDSQGAAIHAAIFMGGRPKDIGSLGGPSSIAFGVNNAGMVVGRADAWGGVYRGFTYEIGKSLFMRSLPTLGGQYSEATAINNDGLIVGSATLSSGFQHAVAWRNGAITDVGTLVPGDLNTSSAATAVSSNGLIVGTSTGPDGLAHGFLLDTAGAMKDLGMFPDSSTTSPLGVNASGVVIGRAKVRGIGYRRRLAPWVLDAAGMANINTRLTTTAWNVVDVAAINDAGQIAGTAAGIDGMQHAVLLTPN